MTLTIIERAQATDDDVLETPSEQDAEEPSTISSGKGVGLHELDAPPVEVDTEKRNLRPRKEKGEGRRAPLQVAATRPSKVTVKATKQKANNGPNMQASYNKFR
jgi:hypothetical protein